MQGAAESSARYRKIEFDLSVKRLNLMAILNEKKAVG